MRPASLARRPARLRIMKRVRSKAAAGHMRPTKSCLKTGIEPRATGPRTLSSMGTSRQPMTFWLWWRTAVSSVRISAAQSVGSRDRKHWATP